MDLRRVVRIVTLKNGQERLRGIIALALTFCAGGFLASVIAPHLDEFVRADLTGWAPGIAGGALTTAAALLKIYTFHRV